MIEDVSEQVRVRLDKIEKVRASGEIPYKNGFTPSALAADLHKKYDSKTREEFEAGEKEKFTVAGRIMAIRHFGKAGFVRLKDRTGIFQLFVQKSTLGDTEFAKYRDLDVGDIVFSEGYLFKTKTNELSIHSESLILLTKSLHPLPEKFHGLTDVELRYRQRYLDLIMNEKSTEVFRLRSRIISEVRKFFIENGFMEVETPMMHPVAGGAAARPFVTHHNTLDMDLYLRIAPELYLKRLVVGGFDRVFEINRNFRNEGISIQHNPEFTMLEFYQAYATYENLMDLTENLFQTIASNILGAKKIKYQDQEINIDSPWKRISVENAIIEYTKFTDRSKLRDKNALVEYCKNNNLPYDDKSKVGELMMTIFEEEVESKLIQPTFVTLYPLDVSPLSRKNEADPFLVDRFELFIYGREIANAFSELNDPIDQKQRFEAQVEAKARGNLEACDMDEDYVHALEYGLPPTAGEGIGIDRLVMLFTDSASIRDVILFPQLRSVVKTEEKLDDDVHGECGKKK